MSDTAPTHDTDPGSTRISARHAQTSAPARTSAAAVFSLVLGLIALLAALSGLLAPVAAVLGLIGLVLSVVGIRAARHPSITGRAVAISGLVLSVIGLLLGIAVLIGVASVVSNNPQILDQINNMVTSARSKIPGA